MKEFGISKAEDQGNALLLAGHESGGFTRLPENFNLQCQRIGLTSFGLSHSGKANWVAVLVNHHCHLSASAIATGYTANAWGTMPR